MDEKFALDYLAGKVNVNSDSQPDDTKTDSNPAESHEQDSADTHVEQDPNGHDSTAAPSEDKDNPPAKDSSETSKAPKNPKPTAEEIAAKKAKELEDLKKDPSLRGDKSLPFPKPREDSAIQFKANRKFIKMKQRSKARISELEQEVARLKGEIAKAQHTDTSSMNDEQKADLTMDMKLAQREIAARQRDIQFEKDSLETEEADQIHESRVAHCFSDPSEVEHYHKLLENGRDKFVEFLSKVDPENAVLSYLDDCDVSPIMVRLLMTRPDILKSVVSKRSPMSKMFELKNIESRLLMSMKKPSSAKPESSSTTTSQAKTVATTGKVVGNGSTKSSDGPKTMHEWEEYVKLHP